LPPRLASVAAMTLTGAAPATGISLDGDPALTRRAGISATTTTVLAAAVLAAAAMGSSTALLSALMVFFLDGNALAFPFFFGRLLRPGITVDRQIDLPKDLGSFELFGFNILDHRRRIMILGSGFSLLFCGLYLLFAGFVSGCLFFYGRDRLCYGSLRRLRSGLRRGSRLLGIGSLLFPFQRLFPAFLWPGGGVDGREIDLAGNLWPFQFRRLDLNDSGSSCTGSGIAAGAGVAVNTGFSSTTTGGGGASSFAAFFTGGPPS